MQTLTDANAYDDLGRRTQTGQGSACTDYAYDALSRLASVMQKFPCTSPATTVTKGFAYDAANEVVTQTRDNTAFSFNGYATVNRAYTANPLNQYTAAGPASFTYDANGNLTGDGTNTYSYDAENKLIGASTSGGTTLTYDPLGRLYQVQSATYGATQFLYDGQHAAAEYNGSGGAMLRRFAWGPGADEVVMQDEGGGFACGSPGSPTTRFLQHDDLGSVVGVADCWGNYQTADTYDEYGIPGSTNWGRYQYTGQAWIPDLGMSYYKARVYSPTLGRFLQTDPIGYQDGPNWYAYVHNNPIAGTDPEGTDDDGRPAYQNSSMQGSTAVAPVDVQGSTPTPADTSEAMPGINSGYNGGAGGGDRGVDPACAVGQLTAGCALCKLSAPCMTAPPIIAHPTTPLPPPAFGNSRGNPGSGGGGSGQCLAAATRRNQASIALDTAGVGLSLIPGANLVVAGAGLAVGTASLLNSGVHGDVAAIGIGAVGYHVGAIAPAAEQLGKVAAKAIPILGTFVAGTALVWDIYNAAQDYQGCLAGS